MSLRSDASNRQHVCWQVPGTRFLLSLNLPGKVLYLDTSDFLHPKVRWGIGCVCMLHSTVSLPPGLAPHHATTRSASRQQVVPGRIMAQSKAGCC